MKDAKSGNFVDQIVLITGGSNGIGAALANIFAQEGAHVWLLARREEYLINTLDRLKRSSILSRQQHGYVIGDVSKEEDVEIAINQVIDNAGVPDILINSAGVVHPGEFLDLDRDKFDWMMDTNFFGTVNCIWRVLPGMVERGSGYIVNIASLAAVLSLYGHSAYAPSKSAVLSLSEALRLELKPKGITVSVVLPTDTDTEQLQYEVSYRPPETKALADVGIIHSPDSIARKILRGMSRKKFLILPGIDAKLLYYALRIFGNVKFPIMEWLIRRARSKKD